MFHGIYAPHDLYRNTGIYHVFWYQIQSTAIYTVPWPPLKQTDVCSLWLGMHAKHNYHKPGLTLPKIDFDHASGRYQELLVNWSFIFNQATPQQILCELELLVPHYATWVTHNGYHGEGGQLATHVRNRTPTLASLFSTKEDPIEQTYAQVWEEIEAGGIVGDQFDDLPIRRRVGGAKAKVQLEYTKRRTFDISVLKKLDVAMPTITYGHMIA